ncbi:hypothetical protein [Mucilaginibacter sp. FT3.2]|uniref:hypothetical protein n=1 Tax=Mucilaginibacter sp. FT3.2 TaxID=2723090 RepID=UPI00161C6F2F|nr:hypothetical protein [Mucilaginibacter sp. FT3.2]MBB6231120.1 hypothetical protein [Mucilaginibacter sp. FT3.2]
MITFSPILFEILKSEMLEHSDIKSITPGDCKALSAFIFKHTRLTVSETTLKRVYGFAFSKFKPSLFTIEVMAKYCGYVGWDDFCAKRESQATKATNADVDWKTLSQNAAKITSFTLQALKNRSGIPFNQTVKRKFIDDHLEEFLNGDYTGTVITAPSGYGKTVALCHWIDEKIALNDNKDIILFFSSSALMNVFLSGRDMNDWLLALLGYSAEDDIAALFDVNKRNRGKFYFIIDGLDEHMFKIEQFNLLLSQLTNIFSFYQSHDWFKLVLTMRPSNWINNRHEMEFDHEKWFNGYITNRSLMTNVPLFSIDEIKELCCNINPNIQNFIALDTARSFNHPLYFQFYYKQHKDDFSFNNVDHICIHELISTFILNKVYLGHYATEKILLLRTLVSHMDFTRDIYEIDKLKVNDLLKQYSHAYAELLSIGFLREINTSSEIQFKTNIQFGNNNFLEYTIAKTLLFENDLNFNLQLIHIINDKFNNNEHKLPILKWCVMSAVKNGQQESFELLAYTKFNPQEKSELLMFLGDLLQKISSSPHYAESVGNYFKYDCGDDLFYYFFGLEFVNLDYKNTLKTLLRFELPNNKKVLTYTALATISILQLDIAGLEDSLKKLRSFSPDAFQHFDINPLHCLDAIYQYMKYGIVKTDFFAELTQFYFNPPKHHNALHNYKSNDLIYLLAGYSLLICQKPVKILRFVNALQKTCKSCIESSFTYRYFLKVLTADAYFFMHADNEMLLICDSMAAAYKQQENKATPFMRAMYYCIKIKKAIVTNDISAIDAYLSNFYNVCDGSGNKLPKLLVHFILLNSDHLMNLDPQLQKRVSYNHTKLLRECGLSPEILVKPQNEELVGLKLRLTAPY